MLAATRSAPADRLLSRLRAYLLPGSSELPPAASRLGAKLRGDAAPASFRAQSRELFGRGPRGAPATEEHYAVRRSDPSFVVAEALASALLPPRGAVLDLGCGAGHLTASLGELALGRLVVALDELFPALLLARRFVAPHASLVCADAGAPLPFRDGAFAMVIGCDTRFDLPYLPLAAREMARVVSADAGVACLTHLPNGGVRHADAGSQPLLPGEYAEALAPLRVAFCDEREILAAALGSGRRTVGFSHDPARLDAAPDLVAVGGTGAPVTIAIEGPVLPVPVGPTVWNPLYHEQPVDAAEGMRVLGRSPFRYPSETEAGPFPGLLPETVRVPLTFQDPAASAEAAPDLLRTLLAERVVVTLPAGMVERSSVPPVAARGRRGSS
jgi:SAM-dependent methyltransferase